MQKWLGAVALVGFSCLLPLRPVVAGPLAGAVVAGQAVISQAGQETLVSQTSDRAVIEWRDFSLKADEQLRFLVPGPTSATLNRFLGASPLISGTIISNGAVYLVHPNGMVFDLTSRVMANRVEISTAAMASFDFMNRETPDRVARQGSLRLDGTIDAPAIRATAGALDIGGTLRAERGTIALSAGARLSTQEAAVIAADGGLSGDGGVIRLWSDHETAHRGTVSAMGGSRSGNGGMVEISAAGVLDFQGSVATDAPHGAIGQLLLDPSEIAIVATSPDTAVEIKGQNNRFSSTATSTTSYILVAKLTAALLRNDVIVDATVAPAEDGVEVVGSGKITVSSALSWSGTGNLTLNAGKGGIEIDAAISSTNSTKRNLTLKSIGSINSSSDGVLSINRLTASSGLGGISLGAENRLSTIGTISARAGSSVLLRNQQALALASGATLSAGGGSVALLLPGYSLTLLGPATVEAAFLRLDLGNQTLKGKQSLNAAGCSVYLTGALTGHQARLELGGGDLVFVADQRANLSSLLLDNSSPLPMTGFDISTSGLSQSGGGRSSGVGLVTGGSVTIDGVSTGAARQLRYIEGKAVRVTGTASEFAGSLALVASGAGIVLAAPLTTDQTGDSRGDLWLLQTGAMESAGSAIDLQGVTVAAAGTLTILQIGSSLGDGIAISGASLVAGGNLSLVQNGRVGANQDGIRLSSSAASGKPVALSVGASNHLQLRTNGNGLVLQGDGDYRLRGGKIVIQLLRGAVQSRGAEGSEVPNQGLVLDAAGSDLWFSGDADSSLAAFRLGSGSLTVFSDQSYLTVPLTMGAGTTLANLGIGATRVGGEGSGSLGGLTLQASRDSALNGIGFLYGGSLTIDGVAEAGAGSLTAIVARAILVTGGSRFRGPLSLTSTGGEEVEFNLSSADIPQNIYGGILIPYGITVGGDGEGRHDLRLLQQGSVSGYGLYLGGVVTVSGGVVLRQAGQVSRDGILLSGALTAGGAVTVIQAGSAAEAAGSVGIRTQWATVTASDKLALRQEGVVVNGDGMVIQSSTLSAGTDLELAQLGTVTGDGIRLYRFDYDTAQGLSLMAGSERNWLSLRTQNRSLLLGGVDGIALERGRVLLDLGTGTVQSQPVASAVGASPDLSLTATGLEVYFRGAATGHGAAINLGYGKFFRLVEKSGDYRFDPQDSELGGAGLLPYGITLHGANPDPLGLAVRVAGVLTLDGVHSTRGEELRFLAAEIRITGGPSSLAGGLTLDSSGPIELGTNLTFGAAGLNLQTHDKDLSLKADCVLAGGAVRLELGTGAYDNGAAGYFLATSDNDLSFGAGSIANHSAAVIFKLGRGQVFATGTVKVASRPSGLATMVFVSDYPEYLTDARDINRSNYYFSSLVGEQLAAAKLAVADPGAALWLPFAALSSGRLGLQVTSYETRGSAGLSSDTGTVGWTMGEVQTSVVVTLASDRVVHFYEVTSPGPAIWEVMPTWVASASRLVFDGRNRFDQGLRLATSGTIEQSRGSSLTVTGGVLSLSAGGAITLDQPDNRLASIGEIRAGGAVEIVSQTSLHLSGPISLRNGGSLSLTTGDKGDLILDADLASEGAEVQLSLGGNYRPQGHRWDLQGQKLHLSASGWGDDLSRDQIAFLHVTGFSVKGRLERHQPEVTFSAAKLGNRRLYFTSLQVGSRDYEQTAAELADLDPSSELHPLVELVAVTSFVPGLQWQDSTVSWQATRPASAGQSAQLPREIGLVRVTDPGFALEASAAWAENTTIRFVGINRFGLPLDFGNLPQVTRLEFAAGSSVQGSIILSAGLMGLGGVRAESNVTLPNLRPSGDGTLNLLLAGDLDARQLVLENSVNLVVAKGVLANIDLSNPNNRFGLVTGSTGGGSLRLATQHPRLVLRNLSTAGGSLVVVNSGGDIIAENLAVGAVSFQAVGTVSLDGSFASARGLAAAVTLNSTGTWVLGDVLGDRGIRISGPVVLLSGIPITYGQLDISDQTEIMLDPRLVPLVPAAALVSGLGWEMVSILAAADPVSSGNLATLARDETRDPLDPHRRLLRTDWIKLKLRPTRY